MGIIFVAKTFKFVDFWYICKIIYQLDTFFNVTSFYTSLNLQEPPSSQVWNYVNKKIST